MRFRLSAEVVGAIRAQAFGPLEQCGALLGTGDAITAVMVLENVSTTPERAYSISARGYLHAESFAAQHHLELKGFFHSHPFSTAKASPTDIAQASAGFLYVIVAGQQLMGWYAPSDGALEPAELITSL